MSDGYVLAYLPPPLMHLGCKKRATYERVKPVVTKYEVNATSDPDFRLSEFIEGCRYKPPQNDY